MMSNRTQSEQQGKSFVLAFDFGGTKMAIATATDDRTIIERVEISTVDCGDGPTALNKAIQAGLELVSNTNEKTGGKLAGVGIATIGITSSNGVAMAPNIPGWESLRIGIRIENDVKAAAFAELQRGALKDKNVGIYVNFGTGISIAYTLDGQVIQGHNGASGEIAYFLRDKNEQHGIREGVAPFEEFAGGKAIGLRATEHFGIDMTTKELFQRAGADESARKFVEEILQEIAFHLTNVIISWDPQTVAFGGGLTTGSDIVIPYIEKRVKQFVPFPPDLVVAHFDRDAALHGAIDLAVQHKF
jgi:glucokinase